MGVLLLVGGGEQRGGVCFDSVQCSSAAHHLHYAVQTSAKHASMERQQSTRRTFFPPS